MHQYSLGEMGTLPPHAKCTIPHSITIVRLFHPFFAMWIVAVDEIYYFAKEIGTPVTVTTR